MKKGWLWMLIILLAAYGTYLTYLFFSPPKLDVSTVENKGGLKLDFTILKAGANNYQYSKAEFNCLIDETRHTTCDFGNNTQGISMSGSSMFPTINEKDLVLCNQFDRTSKLQEGNIYLFMNGADIVGHRCVYSPDFGQSCVFKGDGNTLRDGLIQRADVLAKCNWVVRYVG